MARPSSPLRLIRLLALLLQLALPSLGVVADARLEMAGLDDRTHIESEDHECGERGHPEHCALCQFLRTQPLAVAPADDFPLDSSVERIAASQPLPAGSRQQFPSLPRGPPNLS